MERRSGRRSELVMFGMIIVASMVTWLWSLHLESPPPSAVAAGFATYPGGYQQTWTTRYGDTTCEDWVRKMTDQQRWAAAADLLRGARRTDAAVANKARPPDDLVTYFQSELSRVCVKPTTAITDVATELYRSEHAQFAA